MTPIKIIIHHSLTKDSGTVSWGAIRHYHLSLGWGDVGYHAGIELVKSGDYQYYEILLGRIWDIAGTHTLNQNHDSLGLCFVGNFDIEQISQDQLIKGWTLVQYWMERFNIKRDHVYRHSDFSEKTCPGKLFPWQELLDGLVDP